jgi:hypothetical protein
MTRSRPMTFARSVDTAPRAGRPRLRPWWWCGDHSGCIAAEDFERSRRGTRNHRRVDDVPILETGEPRHLLCGCGDGQ